MKTTGERNTFILVDVVDDSDVIVVIVVIVVVIIIVITYPCERTVRVTVSNVVMPLNFLSQVLMTGFYENSIEAEREDHEL